MIMRAIFLFFCLLLVSNIYAQDTIPPRPKIGLALSGGSAHGLAHIGVIRLLEELEIPIDMITGTSMGSIVGSLKAMGYSAKDIERIALNIDWKEIVNNKIDLNEVAPSEKYFHNKIPLNVNIQKSRLELPLSINKSNNLDLYLRRLYLPSYKTKHFNQLSIPFKCFSSDIATGNIIEFNKGHLHEAVRSSMSIPSLFPPIRKSDQLLIDGGLLNNFPASDVKNMGADFVIGSYVGARLNDAAHLNSMVDIMKQAGFMLSLKAFEEQKQYVDLLLQPEVKKYSSLNFELDTFFIEEGYRSALAMKDQLIKIRDSLNLRAYYKPPKKLEPIEFVFIDSIAIPDISNSMKNLIFSKMEIKESSLISITEIEEGIRRTYATKSFESINYKIDYIPGVGNLLTLEAKPLVLSTFGGTINWFNSTGISIILGTSLKNYLSELSDFRMIMRLSDHPGLALYYNKRGNNSLENAVFGLNAKVEHLNHPLFFNLKREVDFDLVESSIFPNIRYEFSTDNSLSVGYEFLFKRFSNRLFDTTNVAKLKFQYQSIHANYEHNTLNHEVFPSKGKDFQVGFRYFTQAKNNYTGVAIDSLILKNMKLHISYKQAIPVNKWSSIVYHVKGKILSFNVLEDFDNFGGVYQNRRNRIQFIGLKEMQIQRSIYLNMHVEYDVKLSQRFHVAPMADFLYDFYEVLIGVGTAIKIDLPVGPLQIQLGSTLKKFNLVPSLGLGYRHIF